MKKINLIEYIQKMQDLHDFLVNKVIPEVGANVLVTLYEDLRLDCESSIKEAKKVNVKTACFEDIAKNPNLLNSLKTVVFIKPPFSGFKIFSFTYDELKEEILKNLKNLKPFYKTKSLLYFVENDPKRYGFIDGDLKDERLKKILGYTPTFDVLDNKGTKITLNYFKNRIKTEYRKEKLKEI